jgi:hypothetical protein
MSSLKMRMKETRSKGSFMKNFNGKLIIVAVAAFLFGLFLGRWTVNPELLPSAIPKEGQLVSVKDRGGADRSRTPWDFITANDLKTAYVEQSYGQIFPSNELEPQKIEIPAIEDEPDPEKSLEPTGEALSPERMKEVMAFSLAREGFSHQEINKMTEGLIVPEAPPPPPLPDGE